MTAPLRYLVVFFLFSLISIAGARDSLSYDLDGIINPSDIVEVGSQVPGILDGIPVDRGDRVEKGQVVARLKSGVEKAAVDTTQAQVEFSKRKDARNEELYLKDLISIHEKDELETEIQISELQLREAIERLDLRVIRSPVQGVVTERTLSPGEYVGEEPIMTIARMDPLYVEVIVPVERLGSIRRGMRAEVRPEPPVKGVYIAKVIIVDQVVDAASGTFGVRLELQNPSYQLPAGLKCKVRFLRK